ncbi:unnamed protein product [Anisakis simplex]|uniref:THAP-type domain-containing protein n=1 Tax=Anisakis simplex TaxID=6269 RepID=A0A0M3IZ39_ANISI|nr:unnamed protein product [Anisakis simplex]
MDLEIDTESADAAVLQLFARREPETMEVVVVGTSVSSRPPKHDNSEDGDDNISEDVQDASNKVSTSYSTAKWRNGTRCIAKGCTNRATDMLNWREELCEHGKRQAICKKCRITQPYRLHYVNRSNHQLTMLFAELLLSKTAYKKINDSACLPAYHWRICSDHFHVSQLGNPMAFPVLGIGKTHAQIREISRRHGVEDQLPANFDEISLECQRLTPCFSLTRNIPSTVSCSSTPDNIRDEWDDSNESIKRYYEWSSRGQRQSNETQVKGQTDSDEDSKTGDGIDKDEVMPLKGGGRSLIDEDEVRGRAEHQHRVRGPRLGRRNLRRRTVQVGKNLVTSGSNKNEMSDSEEMKSQLTKQNKPQQKRENLCQDETVSKVRSKKRGRKRGRVDLGDSHHSIETGASKKHKRTANEKNAQHNYDRTVS